MKTPELEPSQPSNWSPNDATKNLRESSAKLYGIENWGLGYFFINDDGNLAVAPDKDPSRSIDLYRVVQKFSGTKQSIPTLLRFPQILDDRMSELHKAFNLAIRKFNYESHHIAVYPSKVNQKAGIVKRLVSSGGPHHYGLEVGSKAELAAALAMPLDQNALIVCNGYKDDLFFRAAVLSEKVGKKAIIVVEETEDIFTALRVGAALDVTPHLGIRVRLSSRGSGKWKESGGEFAKFGMSTPELVNTLRVLKQRDQTHTLKMLHFHIGSQITDIQKAKQAFKEAARVYAKAQKMGCTIEYLNVGGGLGVDYDGSRTASEFSTNYSLQEFANDVVYTISEVCANEDVIAPIIVTESGRAMVAHHSLLVTEVRKIITPGSEDLQIENTAKPKAEPVLELIDLARDINIENLHEYYHDAIQQRKDLDSLFELGYLGLEDKAQGEWLFWNICRRAACLSRKMDQRSEEFEELDRLLSSKYVCNFSTFQSLPDSWAFNQLFPVLPIHRLDEIPTERGILCDITCDSDGVVDRFVDIRHTKESLELHAVRENEPYYLGFLLIGAYQETLGDLHNLFGVVTEASVTVDANGEAVTEEIAYGDSVRKVLECSDYDTEHLQKVIAKELSLRKARGVISENDERAMLDTFTQVLADYTYLA